MSVYGTKVVVHDKPDARAAWAPHGTEGFYVGPASKHYRCWHCYMPATRSVRITDTIAWLPVAFTMPGHSPLDAMTAAVADLSTALRTLSTDESTLLRDAPAGPTSTLSATIQLLRDMFQPTDITPLANTLNVPFPQPVVVAPPAPFPQPVVVAPPAPLVSAVEHPAPDRPLPPVAPLPPPPISQPIPDVPEASGSPQAPTPPPTLQHKTTACWTEVQPQTADNRTTTNYLRHVNKAIDGTCRITAVQHDTSATTGTLFYLVRSKTGTIGQLANVACANATDSASVSKRIAWNAMPVEAVGLPMVSNVRCQSFSCGSFVPRQIEVPSLVMSTYVFVSVTVHLKLHRLERPAKLWLKTASGKTYPGTSMSSEGVGIRRIPFSVDRMIALLATVTANVESGTLSSRK
jgi:hypothetical protein